MASYCYTAEDKEGRRVDGQVEAATIEEARSRLEQEGLRVLEVVETADAPPDAPPQERLSPGEAQELTENVAQLSTAGIPLAPGLRAAGDESDSPRLARAFYHLADQLDQGRPLEKVLESSQGLLPDYVSGLIRAARETSRLGSALTELVQQHRNTNALRRDVCQGLAYPLLVAGLAVGVLFLIVLFVAGGFERIFVDFGVALPMVTQAFFWWRGQGLWLLPLLVAALVIAAALARWRLGPAGWQRWLSSTPVVGPLWHWLGLLEWIGLLRVLVQHGVTLLEALRLSANAVSDANVGRLSLSLAEGIARGRSLSQMIASQRQLPASLVPLVRWGEQAGGLGESLGMGSEMLEDRVRMRSLWLRTALPPIVFIAIACCVLLLVTALMLPMASLLQNLTGR